MHIKGFKQRGNNNCSYIYGCFHNHLRSHHRMLWSQAIAVNKAFYRTAEPHQTEMQPVSASTEAVLLSSVANMAQEEQKGPGMVEKRQTGIAHTQN